MVRGTVLFLWARSGLSVKSSDAAGSYLRYLTEEDTGTESVGFYSPLLGYVSLLSGPEDS